MGSGRKNFLSLPYLINKMAHKPAQIFKIDKEVLSVRILRRLVLVKNNAHS